LPATADNHKWLPPQADPPLAETPCRPEVAGRWRPCGWIIRDFSRI